MKIPQAILDARSRAEADLLARPGVTGVDVGFKRVAGAKTEVVAIRVFVARKQPGDPAQAIPSSIEGWPTDVIERTTKLHSDATRYNPLRGGASVGPLRIIDGNFYAGTLGCIVTDNVTGQKMILSNYHVLCVDSDFADAADQIIQPSYLEGGSTGDECATLARQHLGGTVDCAVAFLNSGKVGTGEIESIGAVSGTNTAELGQAVRKRGRTSGLTYGIVDGVAGSITTDYGFDIGNVTLTGQITIAPDTDQNASFGTHGDSGSAIVNAANEVVGLYYAGDDDGNGVANQIAAVEAALAVTVFVGIGTVTATDESGTATYLDRSLLDIRPDFNKPKAGVLDDFSFKSEGYGRATPWKVTSGPKRTATLDFTFGTVEETKAFRKFFSDRAGRRRGFWLPIWLDEYRVQLDAASGSMTIRVEKSGLRSARLAWGSFDHLVLATWDKLECYEIDTVADAGDHETITLTSPITSDLVANRTIAGGLLWARMADDRLTFRHKNDLVCGAQVKFVELPMEYEDEHTGEAKFHAYRITRGSTVWRYVNWGADVVMGGHTWYASNITHSSIRSGIEFLPDPVDLEVATDDPDHPFRYFVDRLNQQETTVEILEADADTLTLGASALFVGRIEKVPYREKGRITAKISSAFRYAEQPFPQLQATRLCNNQLFDPLCGLVEATYRTTGTITALDTTIVLPYCEADEFGAKATTEGDPNWFALGKVTAGLEIRMCVGQDGNRLYLNAPFRAAAVDDSVSATAGCDKRLATCVAKFDNLNNHWGFPYIPNSNPNLDELMNPKPVGGKK